MGNFRPSSRNKIKGIKDIKDTGEVLLGGNRVGDKSGTSPFVTPFVTSLFSSKFNGLLIISS